MKYRELYEEYVALLQHGVKLQQELQLIPRGYVVTKHISGKPYCYLQYSVQGKKKSEYLNEEEALRTRAAIARREPLKAEIALNDKEQARLEQAVKILDANLYRTFFHLKQCAQMDSLPIAKRAEAMSFAKAMTALEGLSAKDSTENNLLLWAKGEKRFADFYMPALQEYRIVEDI